MNRSLYAKIFAGLSLAAVAAVALLRVLRPHSPLGLWSAVLVWCATVALWATFALGRRLRQLQTLADALIHGPVQSASPQQSDFDNLAHTLTLASSRVQTSVVKAAESGRQLEALLDSMQDAVVSVDAGGRILWSNERMQRLLPGPVFSSRVRVGHALVQTVRDPDVLAAVQLAIDDGSVNVRRATLLSPGRIFEVIASPLMGGGAVAVLHDITRIEQVERTQRDFIANVSHELRTPLTSISGYVETLLDHETAVSSQGREFLATILKNAARMGRLTEDLLAITQAEGVAVKLNLTSISAETLLRESVSNMSGLVQENEAELEFGELTSTSVMTDADSSLQILGNLIENAIKYGRAADGKAARVIVSARTLDEMPGAVEFSVRDFGPGISYEHLDRIFERFYRVDKARSRASGGTGLGLSIAQHLAQVQGGSIRVESEINGGSNFLFTLPVA